VYLQKDMSSKQQCDSTSTVSQTTKVTETVEATQMAAAAGTPEHHGMMDKLKDQYAHSDKKKLAIGGAVAATALGAAVAGGIALKHHHDAKVAAEHEAERHAHEASVQSVVTEEVSTTTSTTVYDSYKVTTNKGDNKIRYGDKIALKHAQTGRYLSFADTHLVSKVSNQKYVYASGWNKTENEYFQILPGSGSSAKAGDIVSYSSTVRFRHVKSKFMLHSHNHKSCQTTTNNEVTAYSATDANDDWSIQTAGSAACTELQADHQIRLVHSSSKTALYTKEVKVTGYSGDATEVTTSTSVQEENSKWVIQF